MPEKKDKLEILKEQVQTAAELDASRLIAEAEKQAKQILEQENAKLEKQSGAAALSEEAKFEADIRKRVSESRYNAERKVLTHRNKLVDEFFSEIESELKSFCESQKYDLYLSKSAEKADKAHKLEEAQAFCRRADIPRAGKALQKYGITPKPDRNILIGGIIFKYPKKGIFIDMTLDSSFGAQREAFSEKAEMQL